MSSSDTVAKEDTANTKEFTKHDICEALKAAGQASEGNVCFTIDDLGIHVVARGMDKQFVSVVVPMEQEEVALIYVEDSSGTETDEPEPCTEAGI
jgi:hypothetical protein